MVHDRFTVEVGDLEALRSWISALRQVDQVFDAYRVTPGIAGTAGATPGPPGAPDPPATVPRRWPGSTS